MTAGVTTTNTLFDEVGARSGVSRLLLGAGIALAGSALLALAARFQVPVWPVPVTLQSLAAALIAAACGWRIGVATVALYIVEGLSGLPVFASGGGIDYLFRPSFGFILGWLPMAYLIGRAAEAGLSRRFLPMLAVALAACAIQFAFGYAWLVSLAGALVPSEQNIYVWAWNGAVQPFLVWDALKMALATLTVAGAWQAFRRG